MSGRPGRSGGWNRRSPEHHLLHGTWNVTRHGPRPVALPVPADRVDPVPPDWLHEDAQTEWKRLAPILGRNGALTDADADALAAYCESWVSWRQATQKIRQFGMVIKSKDDLPVISPYVRIAHHALADMRAFLVEFGMTPNSRARLPAATATREPAKPSKWAGVL